MCTIGSRVGRSVVGPSCCGTVVGFVVVTSSRIIVGGSEEVTIAFVGTDVVGSLVTMIGLRVGKEEDDALGIPVGNNSVDGARLGDEEKEDDSVGARDGNEEDDDVRIDGDGEEELIIDGDDGDIDAFVDNDDVGKGELDEPSPAPVDSSDVGTNDKLGAVDGNNDTSDASDSVAPPPEDEKVGDGDEDVVVVPFKSSIMIIDGELLTVGAAVGT